MAYRRYRISYERKELVFVEVVAESKAAAKRIALGKQTGERQLRGTSKTLKSGATIHSEQTTDAPSRCKGCERTLGEYHTKDCPFNRQGNKHVDNVQTKVTPV